MFCDEVYTSIEEWKSDINNSDVKCQFDPDKDTRGNNVDRRAIQIGLNHEALRVYVSDGIVKISDITQDVHELKKKLDSGIDISRFIPVEEKYSLSDESTRRRLKIG